MKLKLILILLFFSSSAFAFLIPKEKKITIAIGKYQEGYYEESILILKSVIKPSFCSQNPVAASDAYAVKAASYFRLANYSLYIKSVSAWQDLIKQQKSDSV